MEYYYDDNGYWRCGDGGGRRWRHHVEDWCAGSHRGGHCRRRRVAPHSEDGVWRTWTCGGENWRQQNEADALRKEVDALRREMDELKMKIREKQEMECQWRWWTALWLMHTGVRANVAEQAEKPNSKAEQAEFAKGYCEKVEAKLQRICSDILTSVQSTCEANIVVMDTMQELMTSSAKQKEKFKDNGEQAKFKDNCSKIGALLRKNAGVEEAKTV
eukprot:TRINITY_DN29069_c0_g1_i1.p1 TRINITY_DN29069_c0_g1~~TRINITY_DN29069_c0_g1_i1.p1  ORF type:complete len:216 (+),score=55.55 TRINITY_DN29069_c0_g1_i1:125-772(+)